MLVWLVVSAAWSCLYLRWDAVNRLDGPELSILLHGEDPDPDSPAQTCDLTFKSTEECSLHPSRSRELFDRSQ